MFPAPEAAAKHGGGTTGGEAPRGTPASPSPLPAGAAARPGSACLRRWDIRPPDSTSILWTAHPPSGWAIHPLDGPSTLRMERRSRALGNPLSIRTPRGRYEHGHVYIFSTTSSASLPDKQCKTDIKQCKTIHLSFEKQVLLCTRFPMYDEDSHAFPKTQSPAILHHVAAFLKLKRFILLKLKARLLSLFVFRPSWLAPCERHVVPSAPALMSPWAGKLGEGGGGPTAPDLPIAGLNYGGFPEKKRAERKVCRDREFGLPASRCWLTARRLRQQPPTFSCQIPALLLLLSHHPPLTLQHPSHRKFANEAT